MEKSFELICRLAENFRVNEKAYLAPAYSESRVRQDFIDKFFTALGWDVTHSVQTNPFEQEVKIENNVNVSGSQRRADYAFAIAPNYDQIKFFVEAKKPSRSLANNDDYFQAIRYAWNTRTPIAVLTDFEEFHILDCRYKPNIKNAIERRVSEFRYADYADKEIFAKIFHLFGKEAVASGSLEKYAAALPKKGTKHSGVIQPVDDAFLEELDGYRETLAKAFKKTNPQLQGEALTEAVQRTIDRLVFIRFLEDKGIEEKQIVTFHNQQSAWKYFISSCKRFDVKYNGLIFKSHRILDSGAFNSPDEHPFADICQKLSDPASPYDFNQIPISILGSIYERFLGKLIYAADKRVKVEEKPEVRKAGDVVYTPEYIVKYIVKYGIKTGLNEAFIIDETTKIRLITKDPKCESLIKPFLAGRDIKRYEYPKANKYLTLFPSGWTKIQSDGSRDKWKWLQETYPSIATHLGPFKEAALRRCDKGEYWWELRSCGYYQEFEKPKMLLPDISLRGNVILDYENNYCVNTCYIIMSSDKYLLGIMNSKLITFFYGKLSSAYRGGYLRFIYQYLEQLPIRTINFSDPADKTRHNTIVKLVEQMLDAKQKLSAAITDADVHRLESLCEMLDRKIDEAVYELYGLTEEEIKIVEGK